MAEIPNAPLGDPTPREVVASPPSDAPTGADVVEASLARALRAAATAGRFDIVAQLAKELEARRLHRRCAQAGAGGAGASAWQSHWYRHPNLRECEGSRIFPVNG
jgi:hypothetical protein